MEQGAMNKLNQRGATLIEALFAAFILTCTLTVATYKVAELQKFFATNQTKIEQIHLLEQAKNLIAWSNSDNEMTKYLIPTIKKNVVLQNQCNWTANAHCVIEGKTILKHNVHSYSIQLIFDKR
jgi:Tfp pilus assembly protein PilV